MSLSNNFTNSLICILLVLYSILPSYTKLLGHPIYRYIILILGFCALANVKKCFRLSKNLCIVLVASFLLKAIPLIINGEPERVIWETLEVYLPLVIFTSIFKENLSRIKITTNYLVFASFILCLFGFIEAFTEFNIFSIIENSFLENPELGSISTYRWGIYRIEQSFNTALTYATFLMMCMSITLYKYYSTKNKSYIILLVLQCINCLLTVSRGAICFLVIGIGLLINNLNKNFLISLIKCLPLLVIALFGISYFHPDFIDAVFYTFDSIISIIFYGDGGTFDDDSIGYRHNFQKSAYDALNDPFVLIFGTGEYGIRAMSSLDNNWLLEITGYGILGLSSFIILMIYPALICINEIKISNQSDCLLKRFSSHNNKTIFYKCMFMMLVTYSAILYTVAQLEEQRMFYILWAIIVSFDYTSFRNKVL